ncbi:MAG: hypothetical protein KatS3mg115_1164 [Candidatus Poribacteria bacterium]|nr:MAG: hypothetical protein KatS3mg115_1164 [Candidatus Poribacteria bacterium]
MPKLRVRRLGAGQHVLFMGKDFEVRCAVENVGEAPLEEDHGVVISVSGASLRPGPAQTGGSFSLGSASRRSSPGRMRGTRQPEMTVGVEFKQGSPLLFEEREASVSLRFHRSIPPLPARTTKEVRSVVQAGVRPLLENAHLRMTFVREEDRFSYMILSAQKGGGLQQMATMEPFSRVVYRDGSRVGAGSGAVLSRGADARLQRGGGDASLHEPASGRGGD